MKKALITIIQVLVTLGLLWFVFRDPETRKNVAETLPNAHPGWLMLAFLTFGGLCITGIVRWKILMAVQGIRLNTGRIGALFLIGHFFSQFLPGSTGGDILKIYYVMKETKTKKAAAFLSVLVDRMIGLVALMIVGAVLLGMRYQWLTQTTGARNLVYILILVLVGCLGVIVFAWLVTSFGFVHKLPQWFPLRTLWIELAEAYTIYGKAWKSTLAALCLGMLGHLCIFTSFYFGARAYTSKVGIVDFFSTLPIVNTITSLPISVAGLGAREAMFEELLGKLCNLPKEAVSISLTCYFIMLGWGIVGGIIYVFYRSSSQGPSLKEVREEMDMEHIGESFEKD